VEAEHTAQLSRRREWFDEEEGLFYQTTYHPAHDEAWNSNVSRDCYHPIYLLAEDQAQALALLSSLGTKKDGD
jgi:hypothetical protein